MLYNSIVNNVSFIRNSYIFFSIKPITVRSRATNSPIPEPTFHDLFQEYFASENTHKDGFFFLRNHLLLSGNWILAKRIISCSYFKVIHFCWKKVSYINSFCLLFDKIDYPNGTVLGIFIQQKPMFFS